MKGTWDWSMGFAWEVFWVYDMGSLGRFVVYRSGIFVRQGIDYSEDGA